MIDWTTRQFALVALFVLVSLPVSAQQTVPSPEGSALAMVPRNGDFTRYQGWGRPAEWHPAVESGKHTFRLDPPVTGRQFILPPSAAVIETQAAGRAYYHQTVSLLPGQYQLAADFSGTADAKVEVAFSSKGTDATTGLVGAKPEWQSHSLKFTVSEQTGTIRLYSESPGGGRARFRSIRMTPLVLESAAVPLHGGKPLAGIVLPADPTPAERHACHELQHYVHRITGKTPGLKGRDRIAEGLFVYLGRAADARHRDLIARKPADSYLLKTDATGISLCGNTDTGTLYAVYDFLKQHGCLWALPGAPGEDVPRRDSFGAIRDKVESPDYDIRGFQVLPQDFFPGPDLGWIYANIDDYFDWAVRNRMNAIWTGGATLDLGPHRGHGWMQESGHSFNATIAPHARYFEKQPEWYPLVKGKRMPVSDIPPGLPNQLCVSNPSLRDYTVKLAQDYFRDHPRARVFAMNPMDGPNYNCECKGCRALDPGGYEWNQDFSEFPRFPKLKLPPLSDRYLDYVNAVAQRLAKSHPDRLVEFYTYASREPPSQHKVAPNVLVKYVYLTGRGVNVSLMDPKDPKARLEQRHLKGWRDPGTKHLAYYNYGDWEHPDAALFWYFQISDLIKSLREHYHCRGLLGETATNLQADPIWYAVMAECLWKSNTDYRGVIGDVCVRFYGPSGSVMRDYFLLMDQDILASKASSEPDYHPNARQDRALKTLEKGNELLDLALRKAGTEDVVKQRIDLARMAHAVVTYVRATNEKEPTSASRAIARRAFEHANTLRASRGFMVKLATAKQLQ